MTLNSDAKFKQQPICRCKNDMRILVNFHASTRKSQNWHFDGLILSSVYNVWPKNNKGVMCNKTEDRCKIWSGIFEKGHEEFWPQVSKLHFDELFLSKVYVGQTFRHSTIITRLVPRFKEHENQQNKPVTKHVGRCRV